MIAHACGASMHRMSHKAAHFQHTGAWTWTHLPRVWIYIAMVVLNGAMIAAQQQGAVPPQYAHYVALASFVLAAAMKEFGKTDPPVPVLGSPPDLTVVKGDKK